MFKKHQFFFGFFFLFANQVSRKTRFAWQHHGGGYCRVDRLRHPGTTQLLVQPVIGAYVHCRVLPPENAERWCVSTLVVLDLLLPPTTLSGLAHQAQYSCLKYMMAVDHWGGEATAYTVEANRPYSVPVNPKECSRRLLPCHCKTTKCLNSD